MKKNNIKESVKSNIEKLQTVYNKNNDFIRGLESILNIKNNYKNNNQNIINNGQESPEIRCLEFNLFNFMHSERIYNNATNKTKVSYEKLYKEGLKTFVNAIKGDKISLNKFLNIDYISYQHTYDNRFKDFTFLKAYKGQLRSELTKLFNEYEKMNGQQVSTQKVDNKPEEVVKVNTSVAGSPRKENTKKSCKSREVDNNQNNLDSLNKKESNGRGNIINEKNAAFNSILCRNESQNRKFIDLGQDIERKALKQRFNKLKPIVSEESKARRNISAEESKERQGLYKSLDLHKTKDAVLKQERSKSAKPKCYSAVKQNEDKKKSYNSRIIKSRSKSAPAKWKDSLKRNEGLSVIENGYDEVFVYRRS